MGRSRRLIAAVIVALSLVLPGALCLGLALLPVASLSDLVGGSSRRRRVDDPAGVGQLVGVHELVAALGVARDTRRRRRRSRRRRRRCARGGALPASPWSVWRSRPPAPGCSWAPSPHGDIPEERSTWLPRSRRVVSSSRTAATGRAASSSTTTTGSARTAPPVWAARCGTRWTWWRSSRTAARREASCLVATRPIASGRRPLLAPCDGVVAHAEDGVEDNAAFGAHRPYGVGNHVVVRTDGDVYVVLGHLRCGSVSVAAGDEVRTGDRARRRRQLRLDREAAPAHAGDAQPGRGLVARRARPDTHRRPLPGEEPDVPRMRGWVATDASPSFRATMSV